MLFQGAIFDTPLFCAIHHNKPEVVDVLLKHGVNIHSQNRTGFTPLDMATRNGRDRITELLIKKGANVNQSSPRSDSPLHFAVMFKHMTTITLLLDNKADVNATNGDQATPLHLAQDKDFAQILVKRGAHVNVVNRYDQTPLSYAIKEKDAEWVKLLIKNGAHVNETNRKGETPLFFIGQPGKDRKSSDPKIAEILLNAGARIGHQDINGSTALHAMCYDGDEETIKLLLSKGSDACARNRKGLTPL
ncbi:putative ankyrin repeat protein, partial [Trichophaea hybrida]